MDMQTRWLRVYVCALATRNKLAVAEVTTAVKSFGVWMHRLGVRMRYLGRLDGVRAVNGSFGLQVRCLRRCDDV